MRRTFVLSAVFVIAVAALMVGPAAAAEVTRTIKADLSPGSGETWGVENLVGRMRIVPGSGPGIVAVATVHAESDALAALLSFEEVAGKTGRTLRVRYPLDEHTTYRYPRGGDASTPKWLSWMGAGTNNLKYAGRRVTVSGNDGVLLYADVEVQVPARMGAGTLTNHVGPISARDVEGSLAFSSGSGDIDLDKVSGTLAVETGSGDVKATGAGGSLTIETGSGDILVEQFSGERIGCEVGSGDVTLRAGTARRVSVDTGSGDVKAEAMDVEEFDTDTGSGDVLFENSGSRLAKISSDAGSGDVVLRLGASASFELTADQGSGDLVSRFKDAQAIVQGREVIGYRRGDARVHIDVSTGSGDVVIEPGNGASI